MPEAAASGSCPPRTCATTSSFAYASTVYGAQGATTGAAHLLVGEHTGAAGAYVAMTRGRDHNTAHLVADTPQAARDQWIEVFNRDRADLGPAHAARLAAQEAAPYATHRPLGAALSDLRDAWTQEHTLAQHLTAARGERDQLTQVVPLRAQHDAQVAAGRATYEQARRHATQAAKHADQLEAVVGADTFQLAGRLRQEWDTGRPGARAAAQTIAAGTGRIGQHRGAVRRASDHLQAWAQAWRPIVASLPTDTDQLAVLAAWLRRPQPRPGHHRLRPDPGRRCPPRPRTRPSRRPRRAPHRSPSPDAYEKARTSYPAELADHGNLAWLPDPAGHLAETKLDVAELTDQLRAAQGGSAQRWPNPRSARCPKSASRPNANAGQPNPNSSSRKSARPVTAQTSHLPRQAGASTNDPRRPTHPSPAAGSAANPEVTTA